jgi:hypothetical protein
MENKKKKKKIHEFIFYWKFFLMLYVKIIYVIRLFFLYKKNSFHSKININKNMQIKPTEPTKIMRESK